MRCITLNWIILYLEFTEQLFILDRPSSQISSDTSSFTSVDQTTLRWLVYIDVAKARTKQDIKCLVSGLEDKRS